jgi:hypothetical protein
MRSHDSGSITNPEYSSGYPAPAAVPLEHIRSKVHAGLIVIGGPRRMSKKTKEVRRTAKKAKKAAKKITKDDQKVDTSSVPPKAPFST